MGKIQVKIAYFLENCKSEKSQNENNTSNLWGTAKEVFRKCTT